MFYNLIKTPIILKTGKNTLPNLDNLLKDSHILYPEKILITQKKLWDIYNKQLTATEYKKVIFVEGSDIEESIKIIEECKDKDALIIAFGGGSVLDIVKYSASKLDKPYITVPSTLSNDAIYSCVSRLIANGKKTSFGVQPPIGIVVDIEVIKKSPKILLLAGIADLVSNLSAIQDWLLAHQQINEPINELAYMLAKEAAIPMLKYSEKDLYSDALILDLVNGLVTSGLSMIVSGDTRGTSGAEHLISHAIDEFFSDKSTVHGLQVGWAHSIIEKEYRNDPYNINEFYARMGLMDSFSEYVPWAEEEFKTLIPFALKIRNRYTIFNTINLTNTNNVL